MLASLATWVIYGPRVSINCHNAEISPKDSAYDIYIRELIHYYMHDSCTSMTCIFYLYTTTKALFLTGYRSHRNNKWNLQVHPSISTHLPSFFFFWPSHHSKWNLHVHHSGQTQHRSGSSPLPENFFAPLRMFDL